MSRLIENYGGKPVLAPSVREVPLSSNSEALQFAAELLDGTFAAVVFLTGVGARALASVVETSYGVEKFHEALRRTVIVARGPKPVAVLREWNVPVTLVAPEPNTWHEVLQVIDQNALALRGKRVAVQEYGVPNMELIAGLEDRGATVVRVPVYQWELPEDTGPLQAAVEAVISGSIDVALFTTGIQVTHLFQVAEKFDRAAALQRGLKQVVKASIGPSTSDVLRSRGLTVDIEASHPKMGFLVKEAAEQSGDLLRTRG
ncbi:MAG TPA: uroporphyrinogen-III synthase [Candidatus Acidoferrum sp.]